MHLALCKNLPYQEPSAIACSVARHQSVKAASKLHHSTAALLQLLERMQHDNAESVDRLESEE